jgi:hypothetical protein
VDYRDEIKARTSGAIRASGREHLGPLGVTPVGSSPRLWCDDQGWWLINIEFQPSSGSVATYLNVGLQYPWDGRDHRVFHYGYRRRIGHLARASLDWYESDDQVASASNDFAAAAARLVSAYRAELGSPLRHLQAILVDDDATTQWNRAMARVLLKRHSAAATLLAEIQRQRQDRLESYLQPVIGKRGKPLQRRKNFEIGEESRRRDLALADQILAVVTTDSKRARSWIEELIANTRELLKLPRDNFELPQPRRLPSMPLHGNPLEHLSKQ